ncbi:MAG: DNA polymerase III subunit chi [Sphingomonadales bacterium]|nr:DNA polymerase III subunit chi [Sphingomonadales bacterium]
MQVDFYQLTRDPAEQVLRAIAQKILSDGGRLLVVSEDDGQLARISKALWDFKPDSFLAHGKATEGQGNIQPVLLSHSVDAENDARMIALVDGQWREEALGFDRAFYLFAPDATDNARAAWRALGSKDGVERRYWKQDGGKWRQGP